MCCDSIQNNQKSNVCLQSLPIRALLNCRMGMSSPRVDRGHNFFDLRGGHVLVLWMKVPQVRFLPKSRHPQLTRASLLFQCCSWVLPHWRSFSSPCWCSWRKSWRNQGPRHQQMGHVFSSTGSFLDAGSTSGWSSPSSSFCTSDA